MNADETLWLNQAREELAQLKRTVDYALSPRRCDDRDHLRASMRRVNDLADFAMIAMSNAKQGSPYSAEVTR